MTKREVGTFDRIVPGGPVGFEFQEVPLYAEAEDTFEAPPGVTIINERSKEVPVLDPGEKTIYWWTEEGKISAALYWNITDIYDIEWEDWGPNTFSFESSYSREILELDATLAGIVISEAVADLHKIVEEPSLVKGLKSLRRK